MIARTRDVPPATEDMYAVLHNFNPQQLYTFMHNGMVTTIGVFVGIFLTGIAVTLGISSILLLSRSKGETHPRRHYFLSVHATIMLLALVAFEVQGFTDSNTATIFFFQSHDRIKEYNFRLARVYCMTLVLIAVLTDGLLAWRCFLVQRALSRGSSKWGNLFWIFPACLCGITTVATTIAGITTKTALYVAFGILGFTSNVALNVYATLFITTRLLLHRRMVMACVQDKALVAQHIYIVGILLESAAVNLPVTIVAAIGNGNILQDTMLPIATASQVLAAVLIIYQTALGRAFSRQKEAEISELVEMREHNISGNVESGPR